LMRLHRFEAARGEWGSLMATMTFKACGELVALKSEATHCTVAGDVTMAKRRPVAASAHA
jgi:hypothetical protein